MSNIIYYDSSGVPISHFYQWDSNQKINIVGDDVRYITEVHFCNIDSNEALVVIPEKADDGIIVDVPNILLQYQKPIIAYIFQDGENDGSRTIDSARIAVIPRAKPADYVYTETDVLCYRKLDERIKALEGADGKDYVLTEEDKQEIADIVASEQNADQPLDSVATDNTYLEWYSSGDHAAGAYIQIYSNAKFKTNRYAVKGGTKYHLHGTAVRLFGNYPLAVFSTIETPSKEQPGALIIEATAAEQDFDTTYIPDQDGYVIVAVHTDYGVLSVSQMGGVVKTPLKIQVFGDSLTENGGAAVWPELLADALPEYALTVINSGKGGNTLTEYTVYPPYEWPAGNAVTDEAGAVKGVAYQIANRAADEAVLDGLDTTADLYIIAAGGNDYASGVDLGGFRDGNLSTVYGAVQRIIEQIHSNTAGRILFVTPLQRYNATDAEREASGWLDERGNILNAADGYAQEQLAEVIRDTCGFYGVPVVDFYREAGISRYNIGRFAADGLHVNAQAAKRLAVMVAGKIRQLF